MKLNKIIGILLLFMCLFSVGYSALTDNIKSYHKLDVDSSSQVDSTGNGFTGSVTSAVYTSSGKINGSYSFDGSDDYITISNNLEDYLNQNNDFTLSLWFKTNDDTAQQTMIQAAASGTNRVSMQIKSNVVTAGVYTGVYTYANSATFTDETNFHHAVLQWNDTDNSVRVYLDGVELSGTGTNPSAASTVGTTIGSRTSLVDYFDGEIDEVAVWDRFLQENEILEIYNSGNGLQYPFVVPTGDTPIITHNITDYYNIENISIQLNTTSNTNMSYSLDSGLETSICNDCNNSILNLNSLSQGLHNITLISTNENGQVNVTDSFTIDVTNPVINNNIPIVIYDYTFNTNSSCSDTNLDYCNISIDGQNIALNSSSITLTHNGNLSYNIIAQDLAGNNVTEPGYLFLNPTQYFRFNNIENSSYVINYTFGGYQSNNTYVEIPLYDLGFGTHSLEFYKFGYQTSSFNITFTNTSQINATYDVVPARIEFYVYDQETDSLLTGENLTLNLVGLSSLNVTTTTGIFNLTSFISPGSYSAFVSSDEYLTSQITFTYDSTSILRKNFYLLSNNATNSGFVNVVTYNPDNTRAKGVPVVAKVWDIPSNSFIETYQTNSNNNGESVLYILLNEKIYEFCALYDTGEVCYPDNGNGVIITTAENGQTIPILPALNYPQFTTSFEDIGLTINNLTLTNFSESYFEYNVDYSWINRNGLDVTVCTLIEKNHNFSRETIIDTCSTSSNGQYVNNFLLNKSFSYIFTIYQEKDNSKSVMYSETISGGDSIWKIFEDMKISPIFYIVIVCIMIGIIPLIPNTFLIVVDILTTIFIVWKWILPQGLSIITVGVFIVMGILTLWGLNKK